MIEGTLVRLRARRPDDVARQHDWYADPDTTAGLLMPYPRAAGEWSAAEPVAYDKAVFAVEDRDSGTTIGTAGLLHPSPEHRRAMGFFVIGDRAYRGRGYGLDLVRTVCRFGFESMNLAKVELEVIADNARAVRAYERAGFVREVHRRRALWVDGAWRDEYLMGLFPEELR